VRLAGQHGFTIFEDDPYVELRFGGEPPPTMLSLDAGERVVYASSFSKTICPGVRVGYLIAPDPLVARIAALAMSAYIAPNMLAQAVVNEFCRSGALDRSVDMARRVLAERAATLCGALGQAIPEARFAEPQGGYYLWVELPEGTDGDAFYDAALQRGVQIVKGADFLVDGGGSAFRIAYSGVTRAQIEEGVRRLADAFRSLGAAA
jgi:DNA-binding transcriptional MocR family regulator